MPRGRPTVRALRDGGSLPPAPPEALVINPGIRANRVNLSRRQAMSHMTALAILTFTLGIAASATARAADLSDAEEVAFGELAGKPLRGYLAQPVTSPGKASGGTAAAPVPLPGIIVIHEWW